MMRLRRNDEPITTVPVTVSLPDVVVLPVTVRLFPTVTFPLASLTMLVVDPEGWMMLMDLRVLMAASY